ncbi:MAG: hypothetical protein KatS3mg120_0003 [Erythrobacter sp.]|nr:MAG: hypothetical protein KatS3mg120_0003 [Erythrobacter sp.]
MWQPIPITRTYAGSSCGKLRRAGRPASQLLSLLFAPPRAVQPSRAQSSWERASQLPLFRLALPRDFAQIQVGKGSVVAALHNLNFSIIHNALSFPRSCGGESHPLRGWGRTPQAGSPTPTPRGFAHARRAGPLIRNSTRKGSTRMSLHPSPVLVADRPPAPVASADAGGAILALDLGTTTGWALRCCGRLIVQRHRGLPSGRFDGGGMRYLRFPTGSSSWPSCRGHRPRSVSRRSGAISALTPPTSTAASWRR